MKALIIDRVSPVIAKGLQALGAEVDIKILPSVDELKEMLPEYDLLVMRVCLLYTSCNDLSVWYFWNGAECFGHLYCFVYDFWRATGVQRCGAVFHQYRDCPWRKDTFRSRTGCSNRKRAD